MARSRHDTDSVTTAVSGPVRYSFCIPTFKRPGLLGDLIANVIDEASNEPVQIEIIVVDNDPALSGRPVVDNAQGPATIPIIYVSEPRTNIAHARNAAVATARGDIIVFIDDDQSLPARFIRDLDRRWLTVGPEVVGILASVRASYQGAVPDWFMAGQFFDRLLDEGVVIPPAQVRTGGLAVKRDVFTRASGGFDPRWGRMGGEDNAFFARSLQSSDVVVGSASLTVIERVPAERARFGYVVRDGFRKGMTHALLTTAADRSGRARYVLRSLGALVVAAAYLSVSPLGGRSRIARASVLLARQGGKLFALSGGRWAMYGR